MEINDIFYVFKWVLALFAIGLVGGIILTVIIHIVMVSIRAIVRVIGYLLNLSLMNPYIKQHLEVIGSNMDYEDYIKAVERDERRSGKSSGERIPREYEYTGLEKAEDDKKEKKKKKKKNK